MRSVPFNKHLGQPDVLLTVVQEIGIVLTVRFKLCWDDLGRPSYVGLQRPYRFFYSNECFILGPTAPKHYPC